MASSTTLRRSAGVLISLFVAVFVVAGFSGTAHAVDGYKFWNYFHATDGAWAFSQKAADRGKVLSAAELEAAKTFHRYADVDGDGIPQRTLPGVHPRGAYFVRGSVAAHPPLPTVRVPR